MNRILRSFPILALVALPPLALARPPLLYHHLTSLVAHPSGTVRLGLSLQDVVIHVSAGNSVTVSTEIWASAGSADAKARIVKSLAPKIGDRGGDIFIRAPGIGGWSRYFNWSGGPRARVTVTMPGSMAIDYRLGSGDFRFINPGAPNRITGYSGSGDVAIKSASTRIIAKAGSGDLTIALDRATRQVQLGTGSGDIDFSGTTDSLSLSTGSGDIEIGNAMAKRILLRTGSGDVTAHWQDLGAASLKASSGSGDLVMYFPARSKLSGIISTGSGDVDTDFAATIHGGRHVYIPAGGTGSIRLNLDTGSGDIALRKGG